MSSSILISTAISTNFIIHWHLQVISCCPAVLLSYCSNARGSLIFTKLNFHIIASCCGTFVLCKLFFSLNLRICYRHRRFGPSDRVYNTDTEHYNMCADEDPIPNSYNDAARGSGPPPPLRLCQTVVILILAPLLKPPPPLVKTRPL